MTGLSQEKQEFSSAVRVLQHYVEKGRRLPLYYTLSSGRSIEGLCDRLQVAADPVPLDVMAAICHLAINLAGPLPGKNSYDGYCGVLKEIAVRLTFPFEQRPPSSVVRRSRPPLPRTNASVVTSFLSSRPSSAPRY